jgi:hypothetical protein
LCKVNICAILCAFLILVPAFTYAQAKTVYLSNAFIRELRYILIVRRPSMDLESFLEVMTVELRSSSSVAADVGTFLDAFSTTSLPSLFSRWLAIYGLDASRCVSGLSLVCLLTVL